ncbi:MAG: hypothetical protein AB7K08_02520 [Microbacteriaceae bacterium]
MSDRRYARSTRLRGSGAVPRVFALAVLVAVTVFLIAWVAALPEALSGPLPYVIEILAVALAARSLFVGVLLDGDAILVRGWFRDYRYAAGELTKVTVVPYWKFLDAKDPILSLLKLTPREGWVRELSTTVSWKDRTEAQAAEIRRHLGIEP